VVLPISEVRRIVERVCARQDVLDACAERDLGYVITVFEENGLTCVPQVQFGFVTRSGASLLVRVTELVTGNQIP
jgi:hypothetical protein